MKTREPLYPEFEISMTLEAFRQPPCPPPHGREVLERFFAVLHSQPKNCRDVNAAAITVATELHALWLVGDARIPCNLRDTMKKKIVKFRELLKFLCTKGKKGRPAYAEAVSSNAYRLPKLFRG